MSPEEFKKACGRWCTGVSIVTSTDADGRDCGMTLNSVTSVSLDPPLMLICLDNGSWTLNAVKTKGAFCINILSESQRELSVRFAEKNVDKFGSLRPKRGQLDVPILAGCLMAFECEVDVTIDTPGRRARRHSAHRHDRTLRNYRQYQMRSHQWGRPVTPCDGYQNHDRCLALHTCGTRPGIEIY